MSESSNFVNKTIIDVTDRIIAYGLPILYFLISVAFYLRTYDSAQIKITLIDIGGAIILATWLIKVIEEDIVTFIKNNIVVMVSLFAFLVSGVISYALSPFKLASANELTRRIIYIGFAVIVIKEFDNKEKLRTLFNWLIAAAFVATIYGLIQYLDSAFFPGPPEPGLDPFIWRRAFGTRVFSTFGNPNFYGDFLVIMSPITLAMFMYTRKPHLMVLWLLIVLNVYWTYSKGAWLGFGAGVVIFIFLAVGYFLKANRKKLQKILFAMMIGTLIVVSFGIGKNLKGRTDSASFRIFTWLSTWEMINTNPWLGTGIGTFYITYPSFRRPQIFYIEGKHNTETDHPEDEYLEVWYDEGYVGIGIFLWLLMMFILMGFNNTKTFRKKDEETSQNDVRSYYQLGVLTALLAQLVHNLVCVSLRFVSSGVFLWLLIGIIGALNTHNPLPETPKPFVNNTNSVPRFIRQFFQIAIAGIAVYLVIIFYGYFDADMNHNMAIYYSKQGDWTNALKHYEMVVKENPSFIMAHYFMGNVYNDRWMPDDVNRSIGKYKDVWKLAPNYVQSHHQAGLIYLKWGEDVERMAQEAQKKGDNAKAAELNKQKVEIWDKALHEFHLYQEIDPVFPLNYYRIAWIYMQLGQRDKAEQIYLEHLNFPEKLQHHPHDAWVADWGIRRRRELSETCVNLGNLHFMINDEPNAEKYYKKALELYSDSEIAMKNLAAIYGRKGDIKNATVLWQNLRRINPNDPDVKRVFQQR
ncbi:MAG: O-antigen ligase family protein [Elusimicrobia bacterium]|nr:O-antigen ligase family protein [Candidatus Liberimonas magnetica]